MPKTQPKALLTRLRYSGLDIEQCIAKAWVKKKLPEICAEALAWQQDDEAVVICSITKRVTLSSILQHSRVEGFADPVVEVILDTKKVAGCPNPRKRIWGELVSQNPEAKRLCVTK